MFNVLPGDTLDSNLIDFADISTIFGADGTSSGVATREDVNGSGGVDFADVSGAFGFDGTTLPPAPLFAPLSSFLAGEEEKDIEAPGLESALDEAFAAL